MKRTEAPSPERLLALRKIGVAPISRSSLRWARLALLFALVAFFMKAQGDDIFKFATTLPSVGESLELMFSSLKLLMVFCLVAVALLLFIGFLQSGFMINLLFKPGSPQSVDPQYPSREAESSLIALLLASVLPLGSILIIAWLGVTLIWPEFIKMLNRQSNDIPLAGFKFGEVLLWSSACLAALISLSIWLIDRYRFMIRYRMSRAETFKESD